jgi:hypothetical protein
MPVYIPEGNENPFGQVFSQINYVCDRIQADRGVKFSIPFRILFYSTLTAILEDPSPAWLASQETRVLEFGRLMERLPDIFSEIASTENVAGSVTYFEGLHWLSEHLNSWCPFDKSRRRPVRAQNK